MGIGLTGRTYGGRYGLSKGGSYEPRIIEQALGKYDQGADRDAPSTLGAYAPNRNTAILPSAILPKLGVNAAVDATIAAIKSLGGRITPSTTSGKTIVDKIKAVQAQLFLSRTQPQRPSPEAPQLHISDGLKKPTFPIQLINAGATDAPKRPTMALDLGNLIADLGGQFIKAKFTPPPFSGPIQTQSALQPLDNIFDLVGDAFATGDVVQIDPRTGVASKKCKPRRRRKRLATVSDIRDLASLKSILSPADLKTWIATHSR